MSSSPSLSDAAPKSLSRTSILITPQWLHSNLQSATILDASWAFDQNNRIGFEQSHIFSAQFFDVVAVIDHETPLPNMLPSVSEFEKHMQAMNIGTDDHIVIYDRANYLASARVFWMFRVFGHRGPLSILEGGLIRWIAEQLPVESGASKPRHQVPSSPYKAHLNARLVTDVKTVVSNATADAANRVQVVDARPPIRFEGKDPEARQGMRSGHIPHAANVPFSKVLIQPTGASWWTFADDASLETVFRGVGVDPHKPVINSCNMGMTAAVNSLALLLLGNEEHNSVYDGSWSEYGQEAFPERPVEVSDFSVQ